MKLAATFCLAVLSLAGCATEEVNTGGSYLVTRSTKIASATNPLDTLNEGLNAPDDLQLKGSYNLPEGIRPGEPFAEEVNPDFPIAGVCEDCLVTYIYAPDRPGEITVVSDGGVRLCTIFLDQEGNYDTSNCNP